VLSTCEWTRDAILFLKSSIDLFRRSMSHRTQPIKWLGDKADLNPCALSSTAEIRAYPEREGWKSLSFQRRDDCVTTAYGREIAVERGTWRYHISSGSELANRGSEMNDNTFGSALRYNIYMQSMVLRS
jgi:hypothetical protein